MKIHFVRHGQTDSNKTGKIMGSRVDESLNEEGRKQAVELAEKLVTVDFDMVFTSTLRRAKETAEAIISKKQVPLVIRDELKERDFGSLSGMSWDEMALVCKMDRNTLRKIDLEQQFDYRPFGGESARDVHDRLVGLMNEIKNTYIDKKIIIVANGGILRAAELIYNNSPIGHIDNAAVMEFDI